MLWTGQRCELDTSTNPYFFVGMGSCLARYQTTTGNIVRTETIRETCGIYFNVYIICTEDGKYHKPKCFDTNCHLKL